MRSPARAERCDARRDGRRHFMEKLNATLRTRRVGLERLICARVLAALALALFATAACAAQERAADARTRQQPQAARADDDGDDDEGESREAVARSGLTDPAEIMRRARFVYVDSDSEFVSAHEVEDSLRKRKEFRAWGMVVTRRRSEADLVIEITRKSFSRRFTFTVVDPRTDEVVASGKMRSVLFGKKIPNKVAEQFANRVKVYRPYP
jgi:hypothetical protein